MNQSTLPLILLDQTTRALWEARNVIDCIPDSLWERKYCGAPLWRHVYHMLHSLDLWFINPRDPHFEEPLLHSKDLNNLDAPTAARPLTRPEINGYFDATAQKTARYLSALREEELLGCPEGCEYTRFTLIIAQHRHLHTHMGMLMGFLVAELGEWPRVLGLEGQFPEGPYDKFF